jgi:hypothetical protein
MTIPVAMLVILALQLRVRRRGALPRLTNAFEAQATTGRTAIARHSASCDILPRSGWPTEFRRAGLAKSIETFTTPAPGDPARALQ